MNSTSESQSRNRAWDLLRFACVLPAGIIAAFATSYAARLLGQMILAGWGPEYFSPLVYWVRFILYFLPKNAMFVYAGAMTAPRYRLTTSLVLAVIASGAALLVHVLSQNRVGATNYLHFAAESTGAACGVICLVLAIRRGQRK